MSRAQLQARRIAAVGRSGASSRRRLGATSPGLGPNPSTKRDAHHDFARSGTTNTLDVLPRSFPEFAWTEPRSIARLRGSGGPDRFVRRHGTAGAIALTAIVVGVLLAYERDTVKGLGDYGVHAPSGGGGDYDPLFLSGCLVVIAGLWLARSQSERFREMLVRLADRGALESDGQRIERERLDSMHTAVQERAERWAWYAGAALALVIASSFIAANGIQGNVVVALGGPLVGAAGGLLVGRKIGHMIACSFVQRSLAAHKISFRTKPGHIDGAAGLKPLGDYYLYQALLLAIPAAFLLSWSLIFLNDAWDRYYGGWRESYLWLLALAIAIELAAFVAPLWRVHEEMRTQKRHAIERADRDLGPGIAAARETLEQDLDNDRRTAVRDQLEQLTSSYRDIEAMPTWPLDRKLRRQLTLTNVALIVPLVGQVADLGR